MTEVVYTTDWAYPNYIPFMDSIIDMTTYAPWGFPVKAIPCDGPDAGDLNHWCRLEGFVLDQLANGVDAASGQLSPGLSFNQCCAAGTTNEKCDYSGPPIQDSHGRNVTHTQTGWTQEQLHLFFEFFDNHGIRSINSELQSNTYSVFYHDFIASFATFWNQLLA